MPSERDNYMPGEAYSQNRKVLVAPALGELSIQPRTHLDLILGPGEVRIGKKEISFHFANESRGYSAYRWGFLKAVASRQSVGEDPHLQVKPREAWADMGQSGSFPRDISLAVRRWIPALSYKKDQLVEWNGKRGRGALYNINNSYFLNLIDPTEESQPAMPELPTPAELREAVRHLTQFNFLFNERGILTLDPTLEIALEDYKPDYGQQRSRRESLSDFRAGALLKLGLLIEDNSYLEEFRRGFGPNTVQDALGSYIGDLDPNERFFVKALLTSSLEPVTDSGKVRLEAVDRRGMLLGVLYPSEAAKEEVKLEPKGSKEKIIFERKPAITKPVKKEVSLRDERLEGMFGIVEAVADEIAGTFLVTLNPYKSYRLARIQAVFPRLTTNKLMSAKENGVINPVREQPISMEDVIRIMIHSDVYLRNVFTTRKYKDRIERIIRKVIDENVERVQEELGGQED